MKAFLLFLMLAVLPASADRRGLLLAKKGGETLGPELFTAGTMEAAGWVAYQAPTSQEQSTEQFHGGANSWKYDSADDIRGVQLVTEISVTAGRTYRLSGWFYISSGVGGYVFIKNWADSVTLTSFLVTTPTGSWVYGSVDYLVAGGITGVWVLSASNSGATVLYVDDISFREVNPP